MPDDQFKEERERDINNNKKKRRKNSVADDLGRLKSRDWRFLLLYIDSIGPTYFSAD